MVNLAQQLSAVAARRLLLAIGSLYVVAGASYPFVVDTPVGVDLLIVGLVCSAGFVVFAAGYRLPRYDLRPETYSVIATWCLGGIAGMFALVGLSALAAEVGDLLHNVLILTAIGGVAGAAAGGYDARARTRELELEETVDELRTANQRLEQFTYATSHDLQEPLRMVSSYLRLLESRHREDLDDDAREFLDFAVNGADRMRAMVESLFEYSHVTPIESSLEPTDSAAVLEGVLDDLQHRIEETDATITAGDLPTVIADPEHLARLFEHLLSNALTFSGDDPPYVHVSAERTDGAWRFAVADEGVGVDPEYHDRLFEVFERHHAGDDPTPDAAGFGLALCERIVERHGGDIWVESDGARGATFYFTMPAASKDAPKDRIEPTTR